jgi:hypothetical protein
MDAQPCRCMNFAWGQKPHRCVQAQEIPGEKASRSRIHAAFQKRCF